jgi:alpha-mannosidase
MSSTPLKTFIIASHAHWDREWYCPFNEFRFRLVELIDELLPLLSDPHSRYKAYNLDGQTIVLEDYLEIRPENKPLLKRLIGEEKLLVGPWYILPDEFLVSGESFVHNLLIGKEIAQEFGHFPRIGYLPDCFGHIAQIPQILKEFEIDNVLFWRGLGLEKSYPEIYWRGSDGTKILGFHMVLGYGDGCTAGLTLPQKIQRYRDRVEWYKTRSQSSLAILMHGIDHMPLDQDIVEIIDTLNKEYPDHGIFKQGTFEEFMDRLREQQASTWPEFHGMLRDTKRYHDTGSFILNGILSSRMYIKQENAKSQSLLTHWAEPMAVIDRLLFGIDHRPFLKQAWKWLLRNHPHDSIGGCSIDSVHRQMMSRFEQCQDICSSLINRTFHKLTSRPTPGNNHYQLAIFNPMPFPVSESIEMQIIIPKDKLPELTHPLQKNKIPESKAIRNIEITRGNGQHVEARIVRIMEKVIPYPALREPWPVKSCLEITARCWLDNLPSMGYEQVDFQLGITRSRSRTSLMTSQHTMENDFIKVVVNSDGTFNLTDKTTGRCFEQLGYFEDGGDCGDEYNYSAPMNDQIYTTIGSQAQIYIEYDGEDSCTLVIEHNFTLPADMAVEPKAGETSNETLQDRSNRKVAIHIQTQITLGKYSHYLKIKTSIDNQAKWHRLRVMFPTYLDTDHVQAEQQYDVADLPIEIEQPSRDVWIEDQPMQYPQQTFMDLSDGKVGLAVFNKGLPEFEVLPLKSRTIALTLLRCVGYLSRNTMNSRFCNAGPEMLTPEAQCLGCHTFEYAIYPHCGDWLMGNVLPRAHQFVAELKTFTPIPSLADPEKRYFSLLTLEGIGIMLDACKPAEKGSTVIVRITNYSAVPQPARVHLHFAFKDVKYARLDETILEEGPAINGNTVELMIGPKKIITIAVEHSM